jgi:hypothetical protein
MIRGGPIAVRRLRFNATWLAMGLICCALDERQVTLPGTLAEPANQAGAECVEGAVECAPVAGGPRSCASDADCPANVPSCVSATCACSLAVSELSSDERNCGQCGNDCSTVDVEATCQQGRCIRPGEPGPTSAAQSSSGDVAVVALTAGAEVLNSARHSLTLSAGQAPGGNLAMKSSRYQLRGGFVGASQ